MNYKKQILADDAALKINIKKQKYIEVLNDIKSRK